MALVRPRLTDFHGITRSQSGLDFAIPFLNEDIPLYVDPFLMWRSNSQQDQALHTSLLNAFNHQNWLLHKGRTDEALANLVLASECDEVGLGMSATRNGKRISEGMANSMLDVFRAIEDYAKHGFSHFEELQLYVDGVSKDRISDIACSFLKSFLVDYTVENCEQLGIPLNPVQLSTLYNYRLRVFERNVTVSLPTNPDDGRPILLVPKRWLRYIPWINFEDYFANACPRDDVVNAQGSDDRARVLLYNRTHHELVRDYIGVKERTADKCANDPLFKQLPIISARRKLAEIKRIPSGTAEKADRRYEDASSQLLASLFYPHLDFADTQSRTESGTQIRDLIFYNNRSIDFLGDILKEYGSRQIVFEMKNVKAIDRDHINQLNRYLTNEFGSFGVLVTRHPLSKAMFKNTIDLWSGQRRCILTITDDDISQMVEVFESKQRLPVEVLKKKHVEFRRACPG